MNNKELSNRIYELLRSSTEKCSDDTCDCLICFLSLYKCACGTITYNKCNKCKHVVCETCENYDNYRRLCKECFATSW